MSLANIARALRGGKLRRGGIATRVTPAVLALGLLMACSKPDGNRILGHWRAERFAAQGISVPMGPEFEVTPDAIRSPGGDIEIPISAITAKGDDITLEGPMSLGLSFHFEDANRISVNLPFVGKLYYRRVELIAPSASSTPASPKGPPRGQSSASVRGSSSASIQPTPTPAASAAQTSGTPNTGTPPAQAGMEDYRRALAAIQQGDPDGAVRSLHASLQQGFRRFDLIDASGDLDTLKSDPRYQALMGRYR